MNGPSVIRVPDWVKKPLWGVTTCILRITKANSSGWWTDGQQWPVDAAEAQFWARKNGYSQFTQAAESSDGIHFEVRPAITKDSYLRVFQYGGYFYAHGAARAFAALQGSARELRAGSK